MTSDPKEIETFTLEVLAKHPNLPATVKSNFSKHLENNYSSNEYDAAYIEWVAIVETVHHLDKRIGNSIRGGEGLLNYEMPRGERQHIVDDVPVEYTAQVFDDIKLLSELHRAERHLDITAQAHSFNGGDGTRSAPIYGAKEKRAEILRRGPAIFVRDSDALLKRLENYLNEKADDYELFLVRHGDALRHENRELVQAAITLLATAAQDVKEFEPASADRGWAEYAKVVEKVFER